MTIMAVPGPPEHLTDPTAGFGVGAGDADGVGDEGVGVGSDDWVGVGAELTTGEVSAVDFGAPQAITINPKNATAAERFKTITSA